MGGGRGKEGRGGEGEEKEKGTGRWDLVTLCPPWVFGPFLGEVTPEGLNYSVGSWYRAVVLETLPLPPPFNVYVGSLE